MVTRCNDARQARNGISVNRFLNRCAIAMRNALIRRLRLARNRSAGAGRCSAVPLPACPSLEPLVLMQQAADSQGARLHGTRDRFRSNLVMQCDARTSDDDCLRSTLNSQSDLSSGCPLDDYHETSHGHRTLAAIVHWSI